MSGHPDSEAPPTAEDRLTSIAEYLEVVIGALISLLVTRGYSDADVRQVADECVTQALTARAEWPEYDDGPAAPPAVSAVTQHDPQTDA